ncbi:MAG: nitroreductase family protein [Spirochaetia bacterium]
MKSRALVLVLALSAAIAFSQDIAVSAPPAKLGVDILDAIRARVAARSFVKRDVPAVDLSTVVWAANGLKGSADAVSSASKAGGTLPVSGNVNYINLYVLTAQGVYRFLPESSLLKQVSSGDARGLITSENIAASAFMLLFTCDTTRLPVFVKNNPAGGREMAMGTASYGAENAALVAAGLKLASIVMFNVKPAAVAQAAKLPREEVPLFIMQLGYTQ